MGRLAGNLVESSVEVGGGTGDSDEVGDGDREGFVGLGLVDWMFWRFWSR